MPDQKSLRYENGLLALLFIVFGLVFFDRMAITVLFPSIAMELGLANRHLGILSAALALTWALAGILVPIACDIRGTRKSMLVVAVVAFSVFSGLSGLASGFASLLVLRALMGMAEGPVLPLSQALMAAASGQSRRGLNMGLLQGSAAGLFGTVLAPPIVIAIAEASNWRTALFVSCIPGLVVAVLIWRYVRENVGTPVQRPATSANLLQSARANISSALKYRNVVVCLAIACVYIAWFILIVSFAPTFLVQGKHFSNSTMSWVMSALGAGHVFWGFAVPWISDRVGRRPAMLVFSAISVFAPLCLIYVDSPITLSVLLFATYTGLGCFTLFMSTIPAETVPANQIASTIGMIMGFGEIVGGFLAPTVAGFAADAYGMSIPFWLATVGAACAFVLSLFLKETVTRAIAPALAT